MAFSGLGELLDPWRMEVADLLVGLPHAYFNRGTSGASGVRPGPAIRTSAKTRGDPMSVVQAKATPTKQYVDFQQVQVAVACP